MRVRVCERVRVRVRVRVSWAQLAVVLRSRGAHAFRRAVLLQPARYTHAVAGDVDRVVLRRKREFT